MILRQVLQIKGDFHRRLSATDSGDRDIRICENLKRTCIMSVLRFDWRTTSERSKDFDVKCLEEIYVAPSASPLQLLAAPRGAELCKPMLCSFILLTYFQSSLYMLYHVFYIFMEDLNKTDFFFTSDNKHVLYFLLTAALLNTTNFINPITDHDSRAVSGGECWASPRFSRGALALLPRGEALRCTAGTFHHT